MIDIGQQEEMFIAIGKLLYKKLEVYAIGGTAMMLRSIKNSTLDIDFVFRSGRDRELFMDVLRKLGSKDSDVTFVYGLKKGTPLMLEFNDCRFDMFLDKVITSNFSDGMKERAKEVHEFGNLVINVADPGDILIMKSATSRGKDDEDITSILKNIQIDWNLIIKEAKEQVKLGNRDAILDLGEKLEKLDKQGAITVPKSILDELWELLKKQVEKNNKVKNKRG